MIRTTAVPKPQHSHLRAGLAAASVVGVVALAGCGTAADAEETTPTAASTSTPTATTTPTAEPTTDSTASDSDYVDGTYTAEGSYSTPESVETISVTITLEDDIITAVEVTGTPSKRESEEYQSEFIGGIAAVVVGKDIDEISVSRVAGSSLTSGGFNEAIEEIKAEAAA
ncbi:hypothetical protein [Microbacterium sp.]|uniref:FMN-binding protein n=1 Tax=Microbacterium sp. TaxID=51671 RepID=UPI0039E2FA1E